MPVDLDLYRRAAARCTVSEPHRDADEDVPCSGCLLAAVRQLSIPRSALASTSSSVAPQPCAEDVDGTTGRVPGPPPSQAGGPTPNSNRWQFALPAAECGPVRPR